MDKIIELLQEALAPSLKPLWESLVFWRTATLMLALVILAAIKYRERLLKWVNRADYLAHDQQVFDAANAILTEPALNNILSDLTGDHSYYSTRMRLLDRFADYFRLTSNRFLDKELQSKADAVVDAFDMLRAFTLKWFFRFPQDQRELEDTRLCLFPRGNPDREGMGEPEKERQYAQLADQLRQLVSAAQSAFNAHRSSVKNRLRK